LIEKYNVYRKQQVQRMKQIPTTAGLDLDGLIQNEIFGGGTPLLYSLQGGPVLRVISKMEDLGFSWNLCNCEYRPGFKNADFEIAGEEPFHAAHKQLPVAICIAALKAIRGEREPD